MKCTICGKEISISEYKCLEFKNYPDTVHAWTGSQRPSFTVPMAFVAACEDCFNDFDNADSYLEYVTGEEKIDCEECGRKFFEDEGTYKKEGFVCQECGHYREHINWGRI